MQNLFYVLFNYRKYEVNKKRPQVTQNARGGYNINSNVTHKNSQQLVVPCTLVPDFIVSVKPLGSNRFNKTPEGSARSNMPISKTPKTPVEAPMFESKTPVRAGMAVPC